MGSFMWRFILWQSLLLVLIALSLTACGSEQAASAPTTEATRPVAVTATATTLAATATLLIATPTTTLNISPTVAAAPTKPPLPADWQYRWLKGIPCKPPCWEGITPGQTTAKEAVDILKQSPIVANSKLILPQGGASYGYITWTLIETLTNISEANAESNLFYNKSNQIVDLISPHLPNYQFGEIIKAYNEPSYVVAGYETHRGKIAYYHIYVSSQ